LDVDKIYSEPFILGGYPYMVCYLNEWIPISLTFLCFDVIWLCFRRILLFPKGNKNKGEVNHLSIYLEAVKTANMSEGWSRQVKLRLSVFNQIETDETITCGIFSFFSSSPFSVQNCW
jgi:hypothetical protein